MNTSTNTSRSLILYTRLYKALLTIYPSEFQQVYGGPMLQVFSDSCRRAQRESGAPGMLLLWIRTMLDTVQTAIEEHSQRGVDMSKEKFIKLSGLSMILGGFLVLLGGLAMMRPEYERYNARSLSIDQYANAAGVPLFVMGLLLVSVGFIGLFLRYGQGVGSFGRYFLGLGALCGVIGAGGAIGLAVFESEPWWTLFFYGLLFQFFGLTMFGIANLQKPSLSRWNVLPVFAGVWIPSYYLVSIIIEQVNGRWVESPPAVNLILLLFTLAGLVGLGYQLLSESQSTVIATAAV